MASKPKGGKAKGKKATNGYSRPEALKLGFVLTDFTKKQWKVGPTIGSGGFGDIYSCCLADSSAKKGEDYPYVIKVEPHTNGPLFVEMHFYMKNGKKEEIEKFRISKNLKHLGMPHLVAHGSQDINGEKHRFLVIPRFGADVWKMFLKNNRRLPEHTVYRIGIQIIHVLEYMHSRTYVHGDIKGANILLGLGKTGLSQCFLVDFGLACHHTTKEFKFDAKKAHNGTIEYTSRDAHQGVPTMRGDFEILGYNLIHWLGLDLPWETQKQLTNAKKVHEMKEEYMRNVDKHLKSAPEAISGFMKKVNQLKFDETPDYKSFLSFLEKGLKSIGRDDKGDLEFEFKSTAQKSPLKRVRETMKKDSPITPRDSPRKRKLSPKSSLEPSPIVIDDSPLAVLKISPPKKTKTSTPREKRLGNLVVNNQMTPTVPKPNSKKTKKTYEFNLELDVSLEADVVVNIKRKKKPETDSGDTRTPELGRSPIRKRIARSVKVTPSGTVHVEKR